MCSKRGGGFYIHVCVSVCLCVCVCESESEFGRIHMCYCAHKVSECRVHEPGQNGNDVHTHTHTHTHSHTLRHTQTHRHSSSVLTSITSAPSVHLWWGHTPVQLRSFPFPRPHLMRSLLSLCDGAQCFHLTTRVVTLPSPRPPRGELPGDGPNTDQCVSVSVYISFFHNRLNIIASCNRYQRNYI